MNINKETLIFALFLYKSLKQKDITSELKIITGGKYTGLLPKESLKYLCILMSALKYNQELTDFLDPDKMLRKSLNKILDIIDSNDCADLKKIREEITESNYESFKHINNIVNIINIDDEIIKGILVNLNMYKIFNIKIDILQQIIDIDTSYSENVGYPTSKTNVNDKLLNLSNNSVLKKKAIDITNKKYLSNPAIGREDEVNSLIEELFKSKTSPLLIGNPGVGKTAIVEGLSYLMQKGTINDELPYQYIFKLNISSLLAGTKYRGDFEENFKKLMEELENNPNILLFIDELHNALGAGVSENQSMDFAQMLKPYLDRNQIKIIGATTIDEYEKYIKIDGAFDRRFGKILVNEPQNDVLVNILIDNIKTEAKSRNILIDFSDEKLKIIVEEIIIATDYKTQYYNKRYYNPAISINIIDLAIANAQRLKQKTLMAENIIYAINGCDNINESVRSRSTNKLLNLFSNEDDVSPLLENHTKIDNSRQKIIAFPKLF
ncbi:MAG: AAA family ATPase [Bacilli bacterium]